MEILLGPAVPKIFSELSVTDLIADSHTHQNEDCGEESNSTECRLQPEVEQLRELLWEQL